MSVTFVLWQYYRNCSMGSESEVILVVSDQKVKKLRWMADMTIQGIWRIKFHNLT